MTDQLYIANKLVKNSAFNVVGWVWPTALNLVTLPYIVHRLGDEAFGVFAILLIFLGLELGLNAASVKYIAEYYAKQQPEKIEEVLSLTWTLYLGLSIASLLLVELSASWLARDVLRVPLDLVAESSLALRLAVVGFGFNLVASVFSAVPVALQRFDVANSIKIVIMTLSTALTVIVLALGGGLAAVVTARVLVSGLSVIMYWRATNRLLNWPTVRLAWNWPALRGLLAYSGFSTATWVTSQLTFNLNQLLLGILGGVAVLTYYVVPLTILKSVHNLLSVTASVFFPFSSELYALREWRHLQEYYLRGLKYLAVVTISLELPLALFAHPILSVWMGTQFAEKSDWILTVIALSYLVLSFSVIPFHLLNGMGKPWVNTGLVVLGGVLSIGACFLLIPTLGGLGVALALLLRSVLIVPFSVLYSARDILQTNTCRVLQGVILKPLGIALVGTIFSLFMVPYAKSAWLLIVWLSVSMMSYWVLAALVGVFDAKDRRMARIFLSTLARRMYDIGETIV